MKAKAGGHWMVVYMTHSLQQAEAVERMLTDEGFLVNCRALNRAVSSSGTYELCVLESEAQEARKLLVESGL